MNEQLASERLIGALEQSLAQITEEEPEVRFSERWFLRRTLLPLLHEHPHLATDTDALVEVRDFFRRPSSEFETEYTMGMAATGVIDAYVEVLGQERMRRFDVLLTDIKARHDSIG